MLMTPRPTKVFLSTLLIVLLLSLTGCAAPQSEQEAYDFAGTRAEEAAPQASGAATENTVFSQSAEPTERIVIQNAMLSIVVLDPQETMDRISAMAVEMDGFVVTANLYQTQLDDGTQVPGGSITVRVDASRLNEAITRIESESALPPLQRRIESQDVTADYTDLQSRLRNLQATEAQLNRIMEEARNTEDVLTVYSQLSDVREEIEVLQGRIQYYDQASRLSSIEITLTADEAMQPLTIGGWKPGGVAKDAIQALISTAKFLGNAVIWIILYMLPVLVLFSLIFILPVSLVVRAVRRRKPAVNPEPPAEKP